MGKEVDLDEAEAFGSEMMDWNGDQFLDVTEAARRAGFLYQVRISRLLYERCRCICSSDANCSDEHRLWMFLFGLQRNQSEPPDYCKKRWACTFAMIDDSSIGEVEVVRSLSSEGERTITLMLQ